jgi:hypothetical protein
VGKALLGGYAKEAPTPEMRRTEIGAPPFRKERDSTNAICNW